MLHKSTKQYQLCKSTHFSYRGWCDDGSNNKEEEDGEEKNKILIVQC